MNRPEEGYVECACAGSWFRRSGHSDFTILAPWDVPAAEGYVHNRMLRATEESNGVESWKGRSQDPGDRIFFELEILAGQAKRGRTTLRVVPPSLDIPIRQHNVTVRTPQRDPYPFEVEDEVERGLRVLAMYESAVAAYCEWRGWPAPGPLPCTKAEQAWVAEHGEPETPEWVGRLQVPKQRPVKLDPVLSVLRECADEAGGDVDDRVECVVAAVQRLPKAKAKSVMVGWSALVSNLGTQAHWDAAVSVPGWDWLSGDMFLDLRAPPRCSRLRWPSRVALRRFGGT